MGWGFFSQLYTYYIAEYFYLYKNDIVVEYPSCMALSFLTWIKVGETISDIWYYWSSYLVCCFWGTLSTKHVVQHDFDFCLFAIGIILILREHGWIGCSFFCFIEDGSIFTSKVAFIVRDCSSSWSGVNYSLCFRYESCGLWSGSKMKWLDNMYVVYSCLGPHRRLILEISFP